MFDLTNEIRGFKNDGWENYRQMLLATYPQRDAEANYQHAARQAYIGVGAALIAAAFEEKGVHMLDAPVSGGPRGAKTGKLAIWVGGDKEVFEKFKHVLGAMGDQARYVGPIGQATVAKLVHNCAGYAMNVALAEVFTMGVKAGVDPLVLFEAVRQGALGRRRTFDGLIDQFLPGTYDPPAFQLRHAHKDVSLAVALGKEVSVPMRACNLTLEEMTEALNRGWAERDSRSAMLLQQERAGVKIAVDADELAAVVKAGNG